MESRAVFEKNLKSIRRRSPQLAARLENASSEGIEEVIGPRGACVLREAGVLLGSAYDPEREGRQLAESMAAEPADIMVAVGFGLGLQFTPYCERNPATVIVYEPSLERLRAALERVSITNLLATEADFYIASDPEQFTNLLNARYSPGLRLRVFTHPSILRLDPERVAEIVDRTRRVKDASDTRSLTSISMLNTWATVVAGNGRRIARRPCFGELAGRFSGRPAVVVAAGPSLDQQLPLLRAYRDCILIVAIGQTLGSLRAAGIEPDLVHILESRDVSHQLTAAGETGGLHVALTPDSHPALFDVPTRGTFVATPAASPMGRWIAEAKGERCFTIGGGTVAQGAVGLALALGADPILLIGQDLAFTDGRAYARSSAYDCVEVEMTEDGSCHFKNMKQKVGLLGDRDLATVTDVKNSGRTIWVDGWNEGERVPTWRAYASFIEQYREVGRLFRELGRALINCTEGGARLPGLPHRRFGEMLEAHATESFDARALLDDALAGWSPLELEDFREPIDLARRSLSRTDRDIAKALRFARQQTRRPTFAQNEQRRLEVLRGFARHEKRVRRQLERMPWLDALVQPEIFDAIRATRQTERLDPTHEQLIEESTFLFEAAERGVERARAWFDAFEASFDEVGSQAGVRVDAVAPRRNRPGHGGYAPGPRP